MLHHGSEQPDAETSDHLISQGLGSKWASEQINERSEAPSEQRGASEWVSSASDNVNGRASGPVLAFQFLVVLNRSLLAGKRWNHNKFLRWCLHFYDNVGGVKKKDGGLLKLLPLSLRENTTEWKSALTNWLGHLITKITRCCAPSFNVGWLVRWLVGCMCCTGNYLNTIMIFFIIQYEYTFRMSVWKINGQE